MLWSLLKIVLFIALAAALALGAGYLLELDGGVRIAIGTIELNLTPLRAVIVLLVFLAALWVVLRLIGLLVAIIRFIAGDETALSRYFMRNRERKGFAALADGMMALASGEGRAALTQAARAERYLHRPELTNLLTAQAADMAGDKQKAEKAYKRLLRDERTRFVGIRGILAQRLAEGDTTTALRLAEKAFALKPRHAETQDILLRLQAEKHDWKGARTTLEAKRAYAGLPRDVYRRRDAVLALSQAKGVFEEGHSIEAREAAIEANKLSPDLVPAAVMAAHAYIDEDKPKYAARVLKKAWGATPHPDLAAVFAEIVPDETADARLKRFAKLTEINPDHPETRMLRAELEIAAEDFPAARRALGNLAEQSPTARSLTLMAAIERGEGADDMVVRGWLARALTASRGPQWVCDNCQSIHTHWAPVCSHCAGFDTLSWRVPAEGEVAMPAGMEMLPLIVGPGVTTPAPAADPAPDMDATPEPPAPAPQTGESPDIIRDGEAVIINHPENRKN